MSDLTARDKQELLWRTELVLAINKLRNVWGAEMAVAEFERAITALDENTAITPRTFNCVMQAHRIVTEKEIP